MQEEKLAITTSIQKPFRGVIKMGYSVSPQQAPHVQIVGAIFSRNSSRPLNGLVCSPCTAVEAR